MELLSTRGLPEVGRAAAWGEIYATRMSQCEFTPGDKNRFDAELRIGQLGPVKLARLTVDKCSVERKRSHIVRNSPRLFNFLLQAEGESTFFHCGHEAHLEAGDFVLCDTGLPHYFMTNDYSVTAMVRVPGEILRSYLPTPEQFCGQRLVSGSCRQDFALDPVDADDEQRHLAAGQRQRHYRAGCRNRAFAGKELQAREAGMAGSAEADQALHLSANRLGIGQQPCFALFQARPEQKRGAVAPEQAAAVGAP